MDDDNFNNEQLIAQLSQACNGLFWLSEADYPWRVIFWQDEHSLDAHTLINHYNYPLETKIITTNLDSFFQNAITEQDWHGEAEKIEVQRYQNLLTLLTGNLAGIQVFLVGKTEIDVYILGKSNLNLIIGLSTKIVET